MQTPVPPSGPGSKLSPTLLWGGTGVGEGGRAPSLSLPNPDGSPATDPAQATGVGQSLSKRGSASFHLETCRERHWRAQGIVSLTANLIANLFYISVHHLHKNSCSLPSQHI